MAAPFAALMLILAVVVMTTPVSMGLPLRLSRWVPRGTDDRRVIGVQLSSPGRLKIIGWT